MHLNCGLIFIKIRTNLQMTQFDTELLNWMGNTSSRLLLAKRGRKKEHALCFVEWSPNFAAAHSFRNNGKSGNWSETNPNEIRYFSPFYLLKKSVIRWPFGFSSFSDWLCRCALAWVFEFSMNFKLLFTFRWNVPILRPYSNSISMFPKL